MSRRGGNKMHWSPAKLSREQCASISAVLEDWGWAHDIVVDAFTQDQESLVRARRVVVRKPRIKASWLKRLAELADAHDVNLVFNGGRMEFR